MCNLGQSPHQLIYNLYSVIALTEIKGYAMVQFSYMMLKLFNKGNFTIESDLARQTFKKRTTEKLVAVKNILPHMSTTYWRCDSKIQNLGVTYLKLDQLLQVRNGRLVGKNVLFQNLPGSYRKRSGHERYQYLST